MPTLTITTKFDLTLSPKQIIFTDTTTYPDPAEVNGNFQCTSPSGIVFHTNSGDYTAQGADLEIDGNAQNNVIALPVNGNIVESGVYTIVYTVYNSVTLEYFTRTFTYTYTYVSPVVDIDQTVDCVAPLFTSTDDTNYTVSSVVPTTQTRTHTLYYPNSSVGLGNPTVSSGATILRGVNQFYQGVQTTIISTVLLYNFPDGLIVSDTVTGTEDITVDCVNICGLLCCLNTAEVTLAGLKTSNYAEYQKQLPIFNLAMSLVGLIQVNINCGNGDNISEIITWIEQLLHCTGDCNDCAVDGAPIVGIGVILNNVVVQSGGAPVQVTSVVAGNLTTYTVTLSTAFINSVSALYNTVVVNGTGTGSITNTLVGILSTYTVNMPSVIDTHQFSKTFRTDADGAVLAVLAAESDAVFGSTPKANLVVKVWAVDNGASTDLTNVAGVTITISGGGNILVTLGIAAFPYVIPVKVTLSGKSTILTSINYDTEPNITAVASGGDAVYLASEYNRIITCAVDNYEVWATPAVIGKKLVVVNAGAKILDVMPLSGEEFEGLAPATAVSVLSGQRLEAVCFENSIWTII